MFSLYEFDVCIGDLTSVSGNVAVWVTSSLHNVYDQEFMKFFEEEYKINVFFSIFFSIHFYSSGKCLKAKKIVK